MATFKKITQSLKLRSHGFSLTELLVSIAIIGIMVALLIPVTDRNLRRNSLVNDIDLLKAKVEEVRLMASANQRVGQVTYYAIYFPDGATEGYRIVKLTEEGSCSDTRVFTQNECLIEKISWSSNVRSLPVGGGVGADAQRRLLAFAVPSQRFTVPVLENGVWRDGPINRYRDFSLRLQFGNEPPTASITLRGNTGRLDVEYIQERN